MKISLAWIFDHIDAAWHTVDVSGLVDRFNQTTAEIEGFYKININVDVLGLGQVKSAHNDHVAVHVAEWNQDCTLPPRADVQVGQHYLIKKQNNAYIWARALDFGGDKEFELPAMYGNQELATGKWKETIESVDYIFDIDNKSITNRPDMWGHRGIAREIAAILDVPMIPLASFLSDSNPIKTFEQSAPATNAQKFGIAIEAQDICSRFAGLYISQVESQPSHVRMASRLARVEGKPIDAMVDITNYVMLDLGHPMHAFDADILQGDTIIIRRAHDKEKLTLLDDDTIEMITHDLVIADSKRAISLAGVMGGAGTAISSSTASLFLEAACFDATTIRRTATRYKKRTEASARFEKSMDAQQATNTLLRAMQFLKVFGMADASDQTIVAVGPEVKELVLDVTHIFIEKRLGTSITPDFIIKTLKKLSFDVEQIGEQDERAYRITIPTFRATKDIGIKEDIVEEIGRFYGYHNIAYALPSMQLSPSDLQARFRLRTIKQYLSQAVWMREIYSYAFFDEEFLRTLDWQPEQTLSVQNPVSENWQRLATTLIPHLLKAVVQNEAKHDQLRFFEWARVWHKDKQKVTEKKVLSGIIFDKKDSINFYDAKAYIEQLYGMLTIPVTFKRAQTEQHPWFLSYQTADIMHDDRIIGTLGTIDPLFLHRVCQGNACAFELDGDFLLEVKAKEKRFAPLSKYPAVDRDVSMLIPLRVTVDDITQTIARIDTRITHVALIDFFQKPEWKDQKALTFAVIIRDYEKTLTKEEVDTVWNKVTKALINLGATIR